MLPPQLTTPPAPSARVKTAAADAEIMRLLAADPQRGIQRLIQAYGGLVHSILQKRGLTCDKDDVAQTIWITVLRKWMTYNPAKGSLKLWLCCIASNKAIDHLRKHHRYERCLIDAEHLQQRKEQESASAMHHHSAASPGETMEILEAALACLPENQRRVVELHYLYGMTMNEIAARSASSAGTVKTRLRLALAKLRLALAKLRSRIRPD